MNVALSVPFLREPQTSAGGFESTADPTAAPASTAQKSRAADLFLRGALTPEQLAQATASQGGFEAVIGDPNFIPAVFLELGAAVSRCTCLIRTSGVDFDGNDRAWDGTGFLLGPNVVLTNHHVLNSPAVAAAAECVFNYQVGADRRPAPIRSFRLRPDRLFLTSPARGGLDYTFCWLDGAPADAFGTARVDRRAFAIAPREFANVVSHPRGRMKEVCVHDNKVQWQDDVVVHYTSDTEPGSSGAAVCNNNWQFVALHHASKPSAVPEFRVLNEGIKLSAIAADLERLAGAGAATTPARKLLALFGGTDERLGFFGTLGRPAPAGGGLEAVVNTFRGTEQDLDVAFWNVEWLTKHYATKTPAVAKVIHELNLDVWCLEESSPAAAAAVAKELEDTYGLVFGHAAAEPESADGKQSCTLLWNTATATVTPEPWGEPIEAWLRAKSTDFGDLGLGGFEAVHGRIFDRYPALFRVKAKAADGAAGLEFYLVPVHLKAMAEGSMRRRMASKILAAAIQKKAETAPGVDFMVGGDANAELDTGDFANLTDAGMAAASAADEAAGAFSYIKGPKSLIDHVFLSPNLIERTGPDGFFIVAAEKTFPDYVAELSDHRPVLVRLSLAGGTTGGLETSTTPSGTKSAEHLSELKERLAGLGFEARKKMKKGGARPASGAADIRGRAGYDPDFLGANGHRVPLPGLSAVLAADAAAVDRGAAGVDRFVLPYTHFAVVMNKARRLPFYSAVNIDGTQLRRVARENTWFLDPRIPTDAQIGNEVYKNNDLDRGHMTRRLDPVWGPPAVAEAANADTFCYSNACPQHKDLNQKEWNDLEDYVLDNAGAHGLRVSVFTGPVLRPDDQLYRGLVQLPKEFWKVVVIVKESTGELSATGYVLSQRDMIAGFEAGFTGFGAFRTYQVPVRSIGELTGLDFGRLPDFDPKDSGGLESTAAAPTLVTGPESMVF